jgi:radical SAM superfamily enzyme YgiQ (UPF0313 family)
MIENDAIDAVCRGEGDIAFPELVRRMEAGQDYYRLSNLWFRNHDGTIVRNEIGELVPDLDALPFPDRKLMFDADPSLRLVGHRVFISTRGCPFACSYCFNHAYNNLVKGKGSLPRNRSVGSIIAEIREVKENHYLNRVLMSDDTFLLKPKGWLEEFSERYPREIGIPLLCNVRADLVSEETGRLLHAMRCAWVAMGVEKYTQ